MFLYMNSVKLLLGHDWATPCCLQVLEHTSRVIKVNSDLRQGFAFFQSHVDYALNECVCILQILLWLNMTVSRRSRSGKTISHGTESSFRKKGRDFQVSQTLFQTSPIAMRLLQHFSNPSFCSAWYEWHLDALVPQYKNKCPRTRFSIQRQSDALRGLAGRVT